MKDGLIISFLSIVPKKPVARLMGFQARLRLPRIAHRLLIRWFVWKYDVNLSECQGGIDDFKSLSDFFLRPLLPNARTIDKDPMNWVSPVDGTVHVFGQIENGRFKQSNSQYGEVSKLLGYSEDHPKVAPYLNGQYAIIYLSPKDYHRVHSAQEGKIISLDYRPGKLWPVFPAATRQIPNLFDRNERLVFHQETTHGPCVLAMIGAFGVGRMTTGLSSITTNTGGKASSQAGDWSIERAQELGRFELGSTVILLWPKTQIKWTMQTGQSIRLGSPMGQQIPQTIDDN